MPLDPIAFMGGSVGNGVSSGIVVVAGGLVGVGAIVGGTVGVAGELVGALLAVVATTLELDSTAVTGMGVFSAPQAVKTKPNTSQHDT